MVNDVVVWSSLAVAATSLTFSLFTGWGFFRFWWVTVKWGALAGLAVLGVFVRTPEVSRLAAHADLTGTLGPRTTLVWLLVAEAVLLFAVFVLSALKPWGRLRRGDAPASGRLVAGVGVGFLALAGFAVLQSFVLSGLRATPIAAIDLSKVPDGQWEGEATVGVTARVRATVQGGRLSAVEVLELAPGVYPDLARGVAGRMVERQRIDVDGVTAATTTSRAIQKATEVALTGH